MGIVALGSLFHLAEKDFEIGEYVIPKGASVAADTRPIMYDEQVNGWCFIVKPADKILISIEQICLGTCFWFSTSLLSF